LENNKIDISFENDWLVKNNSYNKNHEYLIETLLAQGNGYLVSRANIEEAETNKINYPGNYITGLFNKALHVIGDKKIERDEIVNLPNSWGFNFKIANSSWFDINRCEITEFERTLNIKNGVLKKSMVVKDKIGQLTRIESERFISFNDPNIFAQKYSIETLNYSGKIVLENGINGNIYNERDIKVKHLYISEKEGTNKNMYMIAETLKSNKSVIIMNHMDVYLDNEKQNVFYHFYDKERLIKGEFEFELKQNQKLIVEKTGYIECFDLLLNTRQTIVDSRERLKKMNSYNLIKKDSEKKWDETWSEIEIKLDAKTNLQPYINFYIYHLLITISHNTAAENTGFPSFSVQGERNYGLAGWEELFVSRFYNMHFPDISKKLIQYRCNRLQTAIKNASTYGLRGALFPWKSGIDGTEQSYREKYDPETDKWQEDLGYLQRHINLSISYNIIHYYQFTNDRGFFLDIGIKTVIEICRFWVDSLTFDRDKNRYDLKGVIGPDEFHTKYKTSYSPGINNNAYTNFMIVWLFNSILDIITKLDNNEKKKVMSDNSLTDQELKKWKDISMFMKIEISDDEIIEQFTGFFELTEIDWIEYRKKFPKLQNIDKILTAEGKSVNDFQIMKQADTLLPFYFLTPQEIREIMLNTGYLLEKDYLQHNFDFYFKRTVHTSLLSKPVHALIAKHIENPKLCYDLFSEALCEISNLEYKETTDSGINMGVAGALINVVYTAFAGIEFHLDHIKIKPMLPADWNSITFKIRYKGHLLFFDITKNKVYINCIKEGPQKIIIEYREDEHIVSEGKKIELK